jgi:hypothetical protein
VYKHQPKTEARLRYWIRYEWQHLEQGKMDKTINSMIKNIPLIIAAQGEYVEAKRRYRH